MSLENSLELNVILQEVENYCSFSRGKNHIKNLQVSYDPLMIRREHELIDEALQCVVKYDTMPFHGISDISSLLENAEKGRVLTSYELLEELRFIGGIREIINYEKNLPEIHHPAIRELTDSLMLHSQLEKKLNQVLNEYGEIKDNASPELRSIRNALKRIDGEIAGVANEFVASHNSSVVDGIITNRYNRTVILIKASEKNAFGGMIYGDSASGQASYVEPPALVRVNSKKQDLLEKEKEEVTRILRECSREVQKVAYEELRNLDTCEILDALFAKAQWGKERNGCVASLSEERSLSIEHARHPLIDPEKVVSNSYHLLDPKQVLLITGPNTGGKTVSMKIIGLFVLMTYVGMPITAEEAVIPYFDAVFEDIGDDQSVVSSLSSFSAHMTKQAEICNRATKHSLVLLDEVGSGTDPQEGEALAIALLNELRQRGTMAIVTTHYDRLKAYGKRHKDILVASVQFDMEKLMPTYRFLEGLTGQSNAFEVARRYGLPNSVIKYARHLKNQSRSEEDKLIERLEKQLNENVLLQEKLNAQISENEKLNQKLKHEQLQLEKEKDELRNKMQQEADAYLDEVRYKADQVLKDLRKRQADTKYHEALDAVQQLNSIQTTETEQEEVETDHEYHVGDAVELRGSSQVCQIIAIKKKDITIDMNGRTVRVKKNQIRPSMHVIPKMKKQNTVSINSGSNIFKAMPIEVNLIGLRVDEAMEKLDAYMDQAKLHHLNTYRVIHGDGSGKLRQAVHNKLKQDKSVKQFRLGMPQEGGTGATVVVMK